VAIFFCQIARIAVSIASMEGSINRREMRNKRIRELFTEMTVKKHLATNYVYKQLSEQFFLEPSTIYLIVTEAGYYKQQPANGQLSLFPGEIEK
jgi:hypothetical protein